MSFKLSILQNIYRSRPFSLKADLGSLPLEQNGFLSCLIVSSRKEYLNFLLDDLAQQSLSKERFEIVVLDGSSCDGLIGQLRNQSLEKARGQYILFLDDDTRIPQKDFLEKALNIFKNEAPDCLIPKAYSLQVAKKPGYDFLDPYSMTTRCCFYRRKLLENLGGFRSELQAYEDIELNIRIQLLKSKILKTDKISYQHPALYFESLQKPLAIGQSIFKLRKHYPWYLWTLIYLNALRFFPLIIIPTTKNRQWFKICLGVLLAPCVSKQYTYRQDV